MEETNFELYEKYLSGFFSKEEKISFENKLLEDLNFAKDFEAYKEVNGFLNHSIGNLLQREKFIENIRSINDHNFDFDKQVTSKNKLKKLKPFIYLVAASAILLFGILFTNNTNPTYQDFVNYNTLNITIRSSSDTTINKAENAFNSRDFSNALKHLNTLLEKHPSNNELLLYKAISLLETEKYSEADKIFEQLYNGYSVFKNKALWWASLSKLKQNDIKGSKTLLKAVPKEAEDYELANKLLKKLK